MQLEKSGFACGKPDHTWSEHDEAKHGEAQRALQNRGGASESPTEVTLIDRSVVTSVTVIAFDFFAGITISSTAFGACGVLSVPVFSEIDPDSMLVGTCHRPALLPVGY